MLMIVNIVKKNYKTKWKFKPFKVVSIFKTKTNKIVVKMAIIYFDNCGLNR